MLPLIAIGTPANGAPSPGDDRVGGFQSLFGVDLDERVDRRIERLDAPQRGLHDLARARSPVRTSAAVSSAETNAEIVHEARHPTY